jgi:ribosomal protein S18 acetylase RimI-like enzyme
MAEQELIVREAVPQDAAALLEFLNIVGGETHFLTLDEAGTVESVEDMAAKIGQVAESDNNAYFLAEVAGQIAGLLSIDGDFHYRIRHIGELFVAVKKDFQGYGIATILFEDAIDWIEELGVIKRLELTVQARNERAISLYEKMGFQLESTRRWGARDEDGNLIDVLEMVRFFESDVEPKPEK